MISLGAFDITGASVGSTELVGISVGATEVWTAVSALTKVVTANNTGGAAKTDWPVKMSLTAANFTFADAETDGSDVRFYDGPTKVPHWVEAWDSGAQTATVWAQFPSIGAGATATLELRYGDGADGGSDGLAVFPTLFDDFDDDTTVLGSPGVNSNPQVGNWNRYATIAAAGQAAWRSTDLREISRIIHDPADPDPNRAYKLYLTGYDGSANKIGLFTSPNGNTWTEYGSNPVITADTDDFCWVRNGSTVYAFVESPGTPGADFIQIRCFTSADNGNTWADQGIVVTYQAGQWDATRIGSPEVKAYSGGWVMIFDGSDGSGQRIGAAVSTDLITWTKIAGNPFINTGLPAVPMDAWQDENGHWWVMLWTDSTSFLYTTTVSDPTLWTAAGWTNAVAGSRSFARVLGTLALAEDSGRREGVLSIILNATPANNRVRRVGFLGTATLTFDRWPFDNSNLNADINDSLIEVYDSALHLNKVTNPTQVGSNTARWTRAVTNNYAVGARMRKEVAGGEGFTRLSVGAGATASANGNAQWAAPSNSYSVLFGATGTASSQLARITSGTNTNLGSLFTISDFPTYHNFELRHTGTTLSLARDGTTLQTVTSSDHDALAKDVMVTQGRTTTNGAKSWWDWLYVRPYDGVDPTVTVTPEA